MFRTTNSPRNLKGFLALFCFLVLPLINQAQPCIPTTSFALGNGSDGEGIAFNPNDGMIWHTSGNNLGGAYFEPVNPSTGVSGTNLAPGNAYPTTPVDLSSEISGVVWYPPLNAFLCMNRHREIYTVSTTGTFTPLSTFSPNFGFLRGFALVGSSVYGVTVSSTLLIEFNPNTGAIISSVTPNIGTTNYEATGLSTNPVTGDVWILYKDSGQNRKLGIINLTTGAITPVGDPGISGLAGITFDNTGKLFAVSGDGGNPGETLFTDFPCALGAPPVAVPTLSQWGLILLGLVILVLGAIAVHRRSLELKTA